MPVTEVLLRQDDNSDGRIYDQYVAEGLYMTAIQASTSYRRNLWTDVQRQAWHRTFWRECVQLAADEYERLNRLQPTLTMAVDASTPANEVSWFDSQTNELITRATMPAPEPRREGRGLCILRQRQAYCPRTCPCRQRERQEDGQARDAEDQETPEFFDWETYGLLAAVNDLRRRDGLPPITTGTQS